MNCCDTSQRDCLLMTVTAAAAVKKEFAFVSSVKQPTYTVVVGRTITVAATAVPLIA